MALNWDDIEVKAEPQQPKKAEFSWSEVEEKVEPPKPAPKQMGWKDVALKMGGDALKSMPIIGLAHPENQKMLKKGYDLAVIPSEKSAEGLKMVTDMIPDPQTKSAVANFILGTPKAGAEIFTEMSATMLRPESLATLGYGGVIGAAGKTAGGQALAQTAKVGILKRIPEVIKRWTTYRYNQPELYKEIAEIRNFNLAEGTRKMLDIAKPLAKRPLQLQRQAASYMKGEVPASMLPKEVVAEADAARQAFTKLGAEAVDLGLLPKSVFEKNVKTYLPRMYRKFEKAKELKQTAGVKPNKIDLQRFKRRDDIPLEVREGMGEIMEAGYPTAKGLTQLNKSVETAKMFRQVARNPEWVAKNADDALARGFEKLPDTKSMGELAGKFVHPEIAADLKQIVREVPKWEKVWNNLLGKWKFGKVIANPSTHFRNMMSNSILMDLGGVDQMQQMRLLPMAAKELAKKGKYYKEAYSARLLGEEFVGGELKAIQDAAGLGKGSIANMVGKYSESAANLMNKVQQGTKAFATKLADLYQGEEQWFKLAKFIKNREMGMGIKEAAADAEKYLFNYSKVSPIVEKLRRSPMGSPFITFTSKALPRVAETVATNPIKLYKYKLFFDAIENRAQKEHNLSDDDMDIIHEQARGNQIVTPLSDSSGRPMTLDLSYIMPWGDIGEQGGFFGLPPIAPPSGPAKTLLEVGINKNMFMDKPIYNETDLPHEKVAKALDHIYTSIMPSLTPGFNQEGIPIKGGYSFRKLEDAITGKKDYFGKQKLDLGPAIASTIFGLKLTPAEPAEQRTFNYFEKMKQTNEIKKVFKKQISNPNATEKDILRATESYKKKLENIWKEDERAK